FLSLILPVLRLLCALVLVPFLLLLLRLVLLRLVLAFLVLLLELVVLLLLVLLFLLFGLLLLLLLLLEIFLVLLRRENGHLVALALAGVTRERGRVVAGVLRLQPVFQLHLRLEQEEPALGVLHLSQIDEVLVVEDVRVAAV